MKVLTLLTLCGLALAQKRQPLYGNPDGILFPGPVKFSQQRTSGVGLSIKRAKEINSIETMEEFLNIVEGVPKDQKDIIIEGRFGNVQRSNAIIPVAARCMPELQPVPFAHNETDPSIVYFPSCTRIKQCGGCCDHPLLSCQPTASVTKNFQVLVSQVNGNGGLTYSEKQIIVLEEHTRCKCDCRIKPEHCTAKQVYIEEECMCGCTNVDEEEKCRKNSDVKLWDPNLCACLCRDELECNAGFYFNSITCRCEEMAFPRRFGNVREPGYRLRDSSKSRDTVPLIVPLGTDDPRRKNKDDPEYK